MKLATPWTKLGHCTATWPVPVRLGLALSRALTLRGWAKVLTVLLEASKATTVTLKGVPATGVVADL